MSEELRKQMATAVWANKVQRLCLQECNGDVDAALEAARHIIDNYTPITFSLKEGDGVEEETDTALLYGVGESELVSGNLRDGEDNEDPSDGDPDKNKKKRKKLREAKLKKERKRRMLKRLRAKRRRVALAVAHAPVGGITIQGKRYEGGEFIPAEVMEQASPEEVAAVKGNRHGVKSRTRRGGPDQRGGRAGDGAGASPDGRGVEGETEESSDEESGGVGEGETKPTGDEATGANPTSAVLEPDAHVISTTAAVKRLGGYEKYFTGKGNEQMRDLMAMVKSHIRKVGAETTAGILGTETEGSANYEKVQYQTTGHISPKEEKGKDIKFMRKYLEESGIKLQTVGNYDPNLRLVTAAPIPEARERAGKGNVVPIGSALEDKLEESKYMPGLESSEDIERIVGAPVKQITKDVASKLDAKYGKGKWIIKSYGDESFAGFGIFFPERLKAIQRDWKDEGWDAANKLKQRGFTVAKDADGNTVGVETRGQMFRFGTEEPDHIQDPEARRQAWRLSLAAQYENGALLPASPEDSLKQDYGVTLIKSGGKVVGIRGLEGQKYKLRTRAMQNYLEEIGVGNEISIMQDLDRAIDAVENPANTVRFMAQPAFPAIGISEEQRALGITWEANTEGRVHVSVDEDGNVKVVPYATMASRHDALPVVFADDNIKEMEKAAHEAVTALPHHLRQNRVFAPDMMKTRDGWKAIEMNTSAEEGSSGWLEANQFVIDAYVAHITGRDPQHVNFIRRILRDQVEQRHTARKASAHKAGTKRAPKHGAKLSIAGPPIERKWVRTPQSSWVHSFKQAWNPQRDLHLVVRFKDGMGRISAACRYDDPAASLYRGIRDAVSKGTYVNQALYHLDYTLGKLFAMGHGHGMGESQPRKPAGTSEGGQFASRGEWGKGGTVKKITLGRTRCDYGTYKNITNRIKGPRLDLNNYKQDDSHSCGFVAALTIARYYELPHTDTEVLKAARASVNHGLDRPTMRKALSNIGLKGHHQLDLSIKKLKDYVKRGIPVIVSLYGEDWFSDHWVIVQGFDEEKGRVYLTNYGSVPIKEFLKDWSDMDEGTKGRVHKGGREGLIVIPQGETLATYKHDKGASLSTDSSGHEHDKSGKFSKKQQTATRRAWRATSRAHIASGEIPVGFHTEGQGGRVHRQAAAANKTVHPKATKESRQKYHKIAAKAHISSAKRHEIEAKRTKKTWTGEPVADFIHEAHTKAATAHRHAQRAHVNAFVRYYEEGTIDPSGKQLSIKDWLRRPAGTHEGGQFAPKSEAEVNRTAAKERNKAVHLKNQTQQAKRKQVREELHAALKTAESTAAQADKIAKNFFLDQPTRLKMKKPLRWAKKKAERQYSVLVDKYGVKGALAIWGAGQVITWGAQAGLIAANVPVPLPPGSGLATTAMLAAVVDVYRKATGKIKKDKNQ